MVRCVREAGSLEVELATYIAEEGEAVGDGPFFQKNLVERVGLPIDDCAVVLED